MTLQQVTAAITAAATYHDLEARFQDALEVFPRATRSKIAINAITRAMRERGRALCDAHPHGALVPRLGPRRQLRVCGETYGVGYGQNSTGERWAWTSAENWAVAVLRRHGIGVQASHLIWDWAFDFPHRALLDVEDALAGRHPDPPLDRLIFSRNTVDRTPVRVNRRHEAKHRAHRPCRCGGMRWDWGAGCSLGIDFITWYCDGCPRIYTEYLSPGRLYAIRNEAP